MREVPKGKYLKIRNIFSTLYWGLIIGVQAASGGLLLFRASVVPAGILLALIIGDLLAVSIIRRQSVSVRRRHRISFVLGTAGLLISWFFVQAGAGGIEGLISLLLLNMLVIPLVYFADYPGKYSVLFAIFSCTALGATYVTSSELMTVPLLYVGSGAGMLLYSLIFFLHYRFSRRYMVKYRKTAIYASLANRDIIHIHTKLKSHALLGRGIEDDTADVFRVTQNTYSKLEGMIDLLSMLNLYTVESGEIQEQLEKKRDALNETIVEQNGDIRKSADIISRLNAEISSVTGDFEGKRRELALLEEKGAQGELVFREVQESNQRFEESSGKMFDMISIIDDIADRTHLLAINSAIEAAGAGEAGAGFAVLAGEIRQLAQEARQNTVRIRETVNENMQTIQKNIDNNTKAQTTLSEIVQTILQVRRTLEEGVATLTGVSSSAADMEEDFSLILERSRLVDSSLEEMERAISSEVEKTREITGLSGKIDEDIAEVIQQTESVEEQITKLRESGTLNQATIADIRRYLYDAHRKIKQELQDAKNPPGHITYLQSLLNSAMKPREWELEELEYDGDE